MSTNSPFVDRSSKATVAAALAQHSAVIQHKDKAFKYTFIRNEPDVMLARADAIHKANITVLEEAGELIPRNEMRGFKAKLLNAEITRQRIETSVKDSDAPDLNPCKENIALFKKESKKLARNIQRSSDSRRCLAMGPGSSSTINLQLQKIEETHSQNLSTLSNASSTTTTVARRSSADGTPPPQYQAEEA